MSEQSRRSPLDHQHRALGAHFGGFAGWDMPLRYGGTIGEHTAVRDACGVFDVSHLGVVEIVGADAAAIISNAFTNDVTVLQDGEAQYTLCLSEAGTVVDDLIVYRSNSTQFRAIPNASNTAAVAAALEVHTSGRDAVVTVTQNATILALQGPATAAALHHISAALDLCLPDLATIGYMTFRHIRLNGTPVMLSRTGYTGEYGFELVSDAPSGQALFAAALDAGVVPCGLAARDTLRLEMGYPLHGHELTATATPLRRNVGFAVRKTDVNFVGGQALQSMPTPTQVMRGVKTSGRRPLRDGMTVYYDNQPVGTLTSGGISPTLGVGIGLGMLEDTVPLDAEVTIDIRGTHETATVTRPPFVSSDPRMLPTS